MCHFIFHSTKFTLAITRKLQSTWNFSGFLCTHCAAAQRCSMYAQEMPDTSEPIGLSVQLQTGFTQHGHWVSDTSTSSCSWATLKLVALNCSIWGSLTKASNLAKAETEVLLRGFTSFALLSLSSSQCLKLVSTCGHSSCLRSVSWERNFPIAQIL